MADCRFPNRNKRITGRQPGLDVIGGLFGDRGSFRGGSFSKQGRQIEVEIDVILVVSKLPAEFLNLKSVDKFQLGNLQYVNKKFPVGMGLNLLYLFLQGEGIEFIYVFGG